MIVEGKQGTQADIVDTKAATESRAEHWLPAAATVLVVLLLLVGQWFVGNGEYVALGLASFGIATILFFAPPLSCGRVRLARQQPLEHQGSDARPIVKSWLWRALFVVNSALLLWLAYSNFAGNYLAGGFWYWLGGIFYFLVAVAQRPGKGWQQRLGQRLQSVDWRVVVALLGVMLLAVFFRVYRLNQVPAEMTSDHAEKLLDVHDVLQGLRPIFFPRNTGREALQFYLTAALIRFTPLTIGHLALKVGTAIFGIIAVPFTYLLAKEFYGKAAGLLAAFFLAISHWHVAITRVGLRFPFTAAFAIPALYFLLRALRYNRRNDWLAAGVVLGVGLHTYTAMRIVPLLFAVLVLFKAGADLWEKLRKNSTGRDSGEASAWDRRFWVNAFLSALLALLLFLPLLSYIQEAPDMFWQRATSRVEAEMSAGEVWRVFWHNTKNALLMFNYRGDLVPANTIPEEPQLGWVSGGMFILGAAYLLLRLLRYRERPAAYVLLCFFTLLVPSILSIAYPAENPSAVRTGGAVPIVMIIVALPLVVVSKRLQERGRKFSTFTVFVLLILLSMATVENYHWYFVRYDEHILRSSWNATEMGQVVRGFLEEGGAFENTYHVPYPHWVDTRNIAINAGDITWRNAVMDIALVNEHATRPGQKLYILHPYDTAALKVLQDVYPRGTIRRYHSARPGKDFILFYVPDG